MLLPILLGARSGPLPCGHKKSGFSLGGGGSSTVLALAFPLCLRKEKGENVLEGDGPRAVCQGQPGRRLEGAGKTVGSGCCRF